MGSFDVNAPSCNFNPLNRNSKALSQRLDILEIYAPTILKPFGNILLYNRSHKSFKTFHSFKTSLKATMEVFQQNIRLPKSFLCCLFLYYFQ